MKLKLFTILSIGILYASCGDKNIDTITVLHDEVMVIHDEVMPKMTKIHTLKKGLRNLEHSETDSTILSALNNLMEADDAMMEWMAAYKKPKEQGEASLKYLANEKKVISEVREKMLTSIREASKILQDDE